MAAFAPPSPPVASAGDNRVTSLPPVPSPTTPGRRSRTSSITQSILDANPHYGFCAATGDALASAPSLKELRRNSLGSANSSRSRVTQRRGSTPATTPGIESGKLGGQLPIHEEGEQSVAVDPLAVGEAGGASGSVYAEEEEHKQQPHWWAVTKSGLHAFWKWFLTPLGFFITIYMLNVVAWGGMLFLLLCNASPAMCVPTCSNINSPRRKWIEIDSQILNALFCVTGFGLIPWRFRDLYFLLQWRVRGRKAALRRLEGIHHGWFRGPQDDEVTETPRAPPTESWKMDFVVWFYVWNTFLQVVLSGFMWGFNRYKRPSWSTGLFVALACIVAGMAGGMVWWEGRKVKRIEGEHSDKEVEEKGREAKIKGGEACGSVAQEKVLAANDET